MAGKPYWIAFGDIHENTQFIPKIPGIREAQGIIISGDLTNRGSLASAREVYETARAANPKVLAQIGNMDKAEITEYLKGQGANIHLETREIAPGLGLMGVGFSTPTPFGTPSEVSDHQIGLWLDETYAKAQAFTRLILVCHTPPHDTTVDKLGTGQHVGSRAVRAFIERVQPDICITGHIHEARGMDQIGATRVYNPGMLGGGGYLRLDLTDAGVEVRTLSV